MRFGLVLSGGGAKGAFEAGVIRALDDEGIRPTVLSGTSAGALNAAAVAAGIGADELVELWSTLESREVYRARRDVHRLIRPLHLLGDPAALLGLGHHTTTEHLAESIGWSWLLSTEPLRRRAVELFGGERLPLQADRILTVSCVDVTTGELVRFSNGLPPNRPPETYREVDMTVDHVLASAAIPGLFQPVGIDGHQFWDGGLVANTPLRAALPFEPDVVFVVAAGAVDHRHDEPESLGRTAALIVDHLMRYAILEDLDHAETVNQLVRAAPGATYHREVELILIAPDVARTGLGNFLDFEPSVARELIAAGIEEGHEAVARWRAGDDG